MDDELELTPEEVFDLPLRTLVLTWLARRAHRRARRPVVTTRASLDDRYGLLMGLAKWLPEAREDESLWIFWARNHLTYQAMRVFDAMFNWEKNERFIKEALDLPKDAKLVKMGYIPRAKDNDL